MEQKKVSETINGGQQIFAEEVEHLMEVQSKLAAALQEAEQFVQWKDAEYMEEKRYMVHFRGEIDPHEMFQNELALQQIDRTGALAVKAQQQLAKLQDSPYFARIDYQPRGDGVNGEYYIGRFALDWQNELLICDWRSPIAGLFYDCEIGSAGYEAPMGRIEGLLLRKRQYKIKAGQLEYALESAAQIHDEVLQRELSNTSDEKMKSIISTIQKEQNQIIRNESAGTLIIQGVAGSGKTSIALHRIAYLLYRFQERLTAQNIMIVSPNRVFSDYISNVLPELGEEPICEIGFVDIARMQLEKGISFIPAEDPWEKGEGAWAERARFKSTLAFVQMLEDYLQTMPSRVFQAEAYQFGRFTASAELIQSRFMAYANEPIKVRLQRMARELHTRFVQENIFEDTVPKVSTILKELQRMLLRKQTLAVYQDFYQQLQLAHLLQFAAKKTLEWADVFPFLYVQAAFEGLQESSEIKHLVVDEMQDYTAIQYAVLNRLFRCPKTILGDYGQCLNPQQRSTLDELREMYPSAQFVQLNKSYRSTYEIINFARQLQPNCTIEAIQRHGQVPRLLSCQNQQAELAQLNTLLDTFAQNDYTSLAIITKTNQQAQILYAAFATNHLVQLLSPESNQFISGIIITSVQMAKGLEFDEVMISAVNEGNYDTSYDRSLLYVACTRAMHKLTLLYWGTPSPFVKALLPMANASVSCGADE